jgi:hypothetical protein
MQEEEKKSVVEFKIIKKINLKLGEYEGISTEIEVKIETLTHNYYDEVKNCNSFLDQLMREKYCRIKNIKLKENKEEITNTEEEKENEAN